MISNSTKNNLKRYIKTKIDIFTPYRENKRAAPGAYKLKDLL